MVEFWCGFLSGDLIDGVGGRTARLVPGFVVFVFCIFLRALYFLRRGILARLRVGELSEMVVVCR